MDNIIESGKLQGLTFKIFKIKQHALSAFIFIC